MIVSIYQKLIPLSETAVKTLEGGESEESDLSDDDFGNESAMLSVKPRFEGSTTPSRPSSMTRPHPALQQTSAVKATIHIEEAEVSDLHNVGFLVGEFLLTASYGAWSAKSQAS